jgi:K+ transporter
MLELGGWSLVVTMAAAGLFVSSTFGRRLGAARGGSDAVFFAMSTWRRGVVALAQKRERDTTPLKEFLAGGSTHHAWERFAGRSSEAMQRNALPATELFGILPNRVINPVGRSKFALESLTVGA